MNSTANLARFTAIGVSAVWAAVLFFTGLDLDWEIRRWLAYLPSAVGLLVVAFDLWLWKIPGVSKATGRPHLYGTWRATLTPNPNSRIPEGGNWQPTGALVIEQTFWTTAVRLHTDQSTSASTTAAITSAPDSKQSKNLYFTYANRARQEHNERSYPHHGTTLLHVTGLKPTRLDGTYWTDRLTSGDIAIQRVNSKVDLSAADALAAVRQQDQS
ncbi:hypothetical protein [Nocardioides panaciterrulae]|uniref:CD-NTase-associated protein 15 domain-containing protein n=1 Tax=Nocardioides panaciterrulae TaxID=661492 RepID=A0A7Y9E2G0_9ACTN|nr:hypothetical protein [Nocardioides panaciterrulae]